MYRQKFVVPRRAARAATLVLALTAVLVPGVSNADFGTPVTLSAAGQNASEQQVAIDADGNALIVWRPFDGTNFRIQSRTRSAAGVLGPIETHSKAGQNAGDPRVAMNAAGDAVVVWSRAGAIQGQARSATGVLAPVELIGKGPFAGDPRVAVANNGDALIVWTRPDDQSGFARVQARSRTAAGSLGPIQNISKNGANAVDPEVAINAAGQAMAVWQRADAGIFRVQARARSAAGVLGPIQTLSRPGQDAGNAQVGIAADGDAVAVWQRSDGTNLRIQAAARSGTNAFGPAQTLSKPGQHGEVPQVAMNADGDALIVWQRPGQGGQDRVQVVARSAAGVFGVIETLSGQGGNHPKVAIDANGDAVVVWPRFDGASFRIEARTRSATGALRPIQTISEDGGDAGSPEVAMTPDGQALAVWLRGDAGVERVQAAAGP